MIKILILYGAFIISGQIITLKQMKSCEVCIIDSLCTDDTIYFNISISKNCPNPLTTYFTYYTDVNSKHRYYNTVINCNNCYDNIPIESVHDAWDYILALQSPEPLQRCSIQYVAHCGGTMSYLIWFIICGLSVVFMIFGVLLYCIKHNRNQNQYIQIKNNEVKSAIINA